MKYVWQVLGGVALAFAMMFYVNGCSDEQITALPSDIEANELGRGVEVGDPGTIWFDLNGFTGDYAVGAQTLDPVGPDDGHVVWLEISFDPTGATGWTFEPSEWFDGWEVLYNGVYYHDGLDQYVLRFYAWTQFNEELALPPNHCVDLGVIDALGYAFDVSWYSLIGGDFIEYTTFEDGPTGGCS